MRQPMDRKGQMTLEIVIMLLLVINIYAYISLPLSEVSMAATKSVGVSAMAAKAVGTIANKINLVGVGGEGAMDEVKLTVFEDFKRITCSNRNITITYYANDLTEVNDPKAFGVVPTIAGKEFTYSRPVDFPASCSLNSIFGEDETICLRFENEGDRVSITSC